MDKEFSLLCVILDRSHVLIFLNIVTVKIILKTVTQFPTNMRFSHENSFSVNKRIESFVTNKFVTFIQIFRIMCSTVNSGLPVT